MSIELVHKHIILRIEAMNPPTEGELKDWTKRGAFGQGYDTPPPI